MTGPPVELTCVAPVFRVSDLGRSLSYHRDQLGFEIARESERQADSVPARGAA